MCEKNTKFQASDKLSPPCGDLCCETWENWVNSQDLLSETRAFPKSFDNETSVRKSRRPISEPFGYIPEGYSAYSSSLQNPHQNPQNPSLNSDNQFGIVVHLSSEQYSLLELRDSFSSAHLAEIREKEREKKNANKQYKYARDGKLAVDQAEFTASISDFHPWLNKDHDPINAKLHKDLAKRRLSGHSSIRIPGLNANIENGKSDKSAPYLKEGAFYASSDSVPIPVKDPNTGRVGYCIEGFYAIKSRLENEIRLVKARESVNLVQAPSYAPIPDIRTRYSKAETGTKLVWSEIQGDFVPKFFKEPTQPVTPKKSSRTKVGSLTLRSTFGSIKIGGNTVTKCTRCQKSAIGDNLVDTNTRLGKVCFDCAKSMI
jgi:hypothetical protein